jgi:TPR repeat protein
VGHQSDVSGALVHGFFLSKGSGVMKDTAGELRFFKLAANRGVNVAQFLYGGYPHDDDAGPSGNESEGARLLKMLADQKYTGATYHYGMCLFTGSGVETNHIEAVKYFK